jgi:putative aminopeptidase FrvX
MKYQIDSQYLLDCFRRIVETPSPVGFYSLLNPVLEQEAALHGEGVTYDNKSTPYITLEGQDNSKTVLVGAHSDTIGLIIRKIDANGWIRVRQMGGINYHSLEGETVTVHTRDGRSYTGLMACQSHSVHVFDDARTVERNENTMMIILDQPVRSKADVNVLGIRHGDIISVDPRCQITDNGYLKSRFIDDKAAVACSFAALKVMKEQGLKPKYRTLFAFPYSEEIGLGGTYVPAEVSEYVAIDIGLIGPGYDGDERKVTICAKDASTPYDYELTNRLIALAEENAIDHAVDIFYRYGTDANAALKAGNNLRAAAFGMAVYCSHGMERTHIDGLKATCDLLLAYLMEC